MRGADYMYEAKNVSAVLGRNSGVSVVFEGDGAYTDGQHIVLPNIDTEADLGEQSVKVARGYVDHEAAHVKWTDQDAWRKAVGKFKRSKTNIGLKKNTMNALEDMRIEKKLIAQYAGSKDNLTAVADSVLVEMQENLAENNTQLEELDPVQIGSLAVTWYGRQVGGYGEKCGKEFERLDSELQECVRAAVDRIDDNSTTGDMVKITEDLVGQLVAMSEERQEEEEDDKGEESDDDDGDSEDDSDPEKSDDDGDDGDDDGSGGDSDGDDSDGDPSDDMNGEDDDDGSEGDGDEGDDKEKSKLGYKTDSSKIDRGSLPNADGYDPDQLKSDAISRELNPNAGTGNGRGDNGFRRFTDRYDRDIEQTAMHECADEYDSMMNDTVGQTNVLRRTLERKLAARMKRSWVGGQMNGRLDSRRLVGAFAGSEHVYKNREESDDLDTAVMIMIDHSGSMRNRIATAAKACIALASALENTPIAYAIQGFTTERLPDKTHDKVLKGSRTDCDSYMPVIAIRYKEFDERLPRVKGKLGGMVRNFCEMGGVNVDGVSIDRGGRELMKRPEKRKVLMVLSDGEPHDAYSHASGGGMEAHLKSVITSLANKGVEVFGIGIESEAVSSYYPNYAVLNDVSDLEKEVIGKMDNLLIGSVNVRQAS